MTTRYRLTELTPSGYGRRLITERLAVARDVIDSFGGDWRIERQYQWDGRWHRDGGRAVWQESARDIAAVYAQRQEGVGDTWKHQ